MPERWRLFIAKGEKVIARLRLRLYLQGMSNVAARRPNKTLVNSLRLRLEAQLAELPTCSTDAARNCVCQAIDDTNRQLREALG